MVLCERMSGGAIEIAEEKLSFRPAAYAVIVRDGSVLVSRCPSTRRFCVPGGGIGAGETIAEALHREVREETGLSISIGPFIGFTERFFYYDPAERAVHCYNFYYYCTLPSCELCPVDSEFGQPEWVAVKALTPGELQHDGELLLNYLNKKR